MSHVKGRPDSTAAAGAKMLAGGVGVALPASALGAAVIALARSGQPALSFAVGALIGLAALAVSQIAVVAASKLPESTVLVVALGAYGLGIGATMGVLWWIGEHTDLAAPWLAGGVVVGSVGYLIGLAVAHQRLRIPVFTDPKPSENVSSSE